MSEPPLQQLPGSTLTDPAALKIEVIKDLFYFDGPVISHVSDQSGNEYIYLWYDYDDNANRWMVIPINKSILSKYMNQEIPLLDVIKAVDTVSFIDIDGDIKPILSFSIAVKDIPEDTLPTNDSFYEPGYAA